MDSRSCRRLANAIAHQHILEMRSHAFSSYLQNALIHCRPVSSSHRQYLARNALLPSRVCCRSYASSRKRSVPEKTQSSRPQANALAPTELLEKVDLDKKIPAPPAPSSTTPNVESAPEQRVAILGAGITGLSTAYHLLLTENPPRITIYEKSNRVGGWIQSHYVDLPGGFGQVLFEAGPHSVRPSIPMGLATVALWEDLGLKERMIYADKRSPAATKRWIYYPDHLVELPHPSRGLLRNLWTILTEPLFKGYWKALAKEMSVEQRKGSVEDESVGAFISRRVNRTLVDKVASALYHGIYAGDIWQLSARSILPDAWHAEKKGEGVIFGMMAMAKEGWMSKRTADLLAFLTANQRPSPETLSKVAKASVVSLDSGLELMAKALKGVLSMDGRVEFKMDTGAESVALSEDSTSIDVTSSSSSTPESFDQVISTVPGSTLSYITTTPETPDSLSMLAQGPSTNVNVVNLFYREQSLLGSVTGFGYLIPQATPVEQNPEFALGVIFDSEHFNVNQDRLEILDTSKPEQKMGTKLTVMLGGHWYNNLDSIPDEQTALQHAKSVVARHLGITAEPLAHLVTQQKDCIPQYSVGHVSRLARADEELRRRFGGRLKVAGASYHGVSINDCVVAGLEIAGYAAGNHSDWKDKTGLEWAAQGTDQEYVCAPKYLASKGIGMGGLAGEWK